MTFVLGVIGWTLFALAIVAGLLLNLVGLFGNWVILGAVAAAWVTTRFEHFGVWPLAGLLMLALLGEVIEAVAAGYGASRFGGGKGAMAASFAGCIAGAVIGTPWFPIVGTVAGAIVGAFGAAACYELLIVNKDVGPALRTGFGAALGKIGGMLAKMAVGIAMLILAALTY